MQVVRKQAEDDAGQERVPSLVERGLFASALEYYGAAGAVIERRASERPAVRFDAEALESVRAAMGALERRIEIAWRAGLSDERIASIARLDLDLVALIVQRQRAGSTR